MPVAYYIRWYNIMSMCIQTDSFFFLHSFETALRRQVNRHAYCILHIDEFCLFFYWMFFTFMDVVARLVLKPIRLLLCAHSNVFIWLNRVNINITALLQHNGNNNNRNWIESHNNGQIIDSLKLVFIPEIGNKNHWSHPN